MSGLALRATLVVAALAIAAPGLARPQTEQVTIEARVVDVSRSAAPDLGIDWSQLNQLNQPEVVPLGAPGTPPLPLSGSDLGQILRVLETHSPSRILANPNIVPADNGVVTVSVQSPVPLPTVDYNQVGIHLTITPTVSANGVHVEIKLRSGGPTLPPGGVVPIVDPRQLDTSVLLPTDSALAISGLFPDDAGESAAKVPFLGDLPVIGALFRSSDYQKGRTKPVALIFPYTAGSAAGVDNENEAVGPVLLQVRLIEAGQSTFDNLGIDWQSGAIGTTVLDLSNVAPGAADPNAVFSTFLKAIEANGLSRMLAEPNLVARSDGSSELNIESPGGLPTIDFKNFGVSLSFTPRVGDDNRITLEITGEGTGPTFPSGGNIPAVETRQLDTSVEVRNGETMAIAGLLPSDTGEAGDKLPFLGDVPVLGSLFRSTAARNDETELVVLVTPLLVGPDGSSGGSGTTTAQPRSTAQATTPTAATQAAGSAQPGQERRLGGSLAAITGRLDQNSRFGGGSVIYPDYEIFASHSPDSIRMTGFELTINLDLNQANLFGLPDVVSRLLSSGPPASRLFASFSRTSGDAEDHFHDSNTGLDYGIVFGDEVNLTKGLFFDGANPSYAGLDSTTRTESKWYRATVGIETVFPGLFGNSRLTLKKSFAVALENLKTDYNANTVVLFSDVPYPDSASQTTTAKTKDQYVGMLLGGTLLYALTPRLSIGAGGELFLSHRSSSAEVRQHNVSSLSAPLDDFELAFDFDDNGLAVGLGAALLAEYALSDRLHFKLELLRQCLPGVTTLHIPETTDQIPVGATHESASQNSLLVSLNYDL